MLNQQVTIIKLYLENIFLINNYLYLNNIHQKYLF